ncbi:hypothetical protein [Fusicatenibacter saccharivorans]|jgi:hypothetical protein|uniref:hypothetical protein n=1 Tax=Fusicatenibacter saccharivorans TaxID=1150298 RepID=UPI002ED510FE
MNKVWEIGRLTKEPEIRYTSKKNGNGEEESTVTASYTLAVARGYRHEDGQQDADFSAALPLERTLSLRKNTFIRELRSLFPDICILAVTQTKTGLKFIT